MESVAGVPELADVWGQIRQLPEPIQLELASRILRSVKKPNPDSPQQGSLANLIGLWDRGQSQFTDEQLDQILAEERTRNHS